MSRPFFKGALEARDPLRLKQAVLHLQHLVAPGPVITRPDPVFRSIHWELDLVSIAVGLLCPQHRGQLQSYAAYPLQGVGDVLPLGPKLLVVSHVSELAATASAENRATGSQPLRRRPQQLHSPSPGHRLIHLL